VGGEPDRDIIETPGHKNFYFSPKISVAPPRGVSACRFSARMNKIIQEGVYILTMPPPIAVILGRPKRAGRVFLFSPVFVLCMVNSSMSLYLRFVKMP
jgi:hypothetical protein